MDVFYVVICCCDLVCDVYLFGYLVVDVLEVDYVVVGVEFWCLFDYCWGVVGVL